MSNFERHAKSLFLACSLFLSNIFTLPTIELVGNSDMIVCKMQAAQQLGYNSFDISSFDKRDYEKLGCINCKNLTLTGQPHAQLVQFVGNAFKAFYISSNDHDSLKPKSLKLISELSIDPNLTTGFSNMSLQSVLYLSSFYGIRYQNYKLSLPKSYLIKNKIPCTALLRLLATPHQKKKLSDVEKSLHLFQDAVEYFTKNNVQIFIALPTGNSHYLNKSIILKKLAQKYQCSEHHILIRFLNSKHISVVPVAVDSMNIVHDELSQLMLEELSSDDLELLEKEVIDTVSTKKISQKEHLFLQNFLMPLMIDTPISRL